MTTRREFLRQGSLFVAAAALVDVAPPGWTRRLFPGSDFVLNRAQAQRILDQTWRLEGARVDLTCGELLDLDDGKCISRCAILLPRRSSDLGIKDRSDIKAILQPGPVKWSIISECSFRETRSDLLDEDRAWLRRVSTVGARRVAIL